VGRLFAPAWNPLPDAAFATALRVERHPGYTAAPCSRATSHLQDSMSMSERRGAAITMVALVIIWGYAWVLAKIGLRYCAPLDFATLRTALGVVTLLPALLWLRKPLKPQHPRHALTIV
jgi:hypothetical protein